MSSWLEVSNVTMPPEEFIFSGRVWAINLVFSVLGLVLSSYVTLALILYQYLYKSRVHHSSRDARERRLGLLARVLCILVAIFVAICSADKVFAVFIEKEANEEYSERWNCNALFKVGNASLLLSSFLAYMFLWTRQRVFYIHKALSPLNSKALTVSSYIILVVWIVYCTGSTIAVLVIPQYKYDPNSGCQIEVGFSRVMTIISSLFVVVTALMQISLLVLFIYPIVKRSSLTSQISRKAPTKSALESRSLARVMWRVKKAIIISVVCIITDIMTPIIAIFTYSRHSSSFTSAYIISITINMLCIIFCFDNWDIMLAPCMSKSKDSKVATSGTIQTTSHRSRNFNNTTSSG